MIRESPRSLPEVCPVPMPALRDALANLCRQPCSCQGRLSKQRAPIGQFVYLSPFPGHFAGELRCRAPVLTNPANPPNPPVAPIAPRRPPRSQLRLERIPLPHHQLLPRKSTR